MPDPPETLPGRAGDGPRDETGVDQEISRDRRDERPGKRLEAPRCPLAPEPQVHPAGRPHRDDFGGDAERGAIRWIRLLDLERALCPRPDGGDDHRRLHAQQQQRRQVGRVGNRQRRSAPQRNRQVDLPRRCHARRHQERPKQNGIRRRQRETGDQAARPGGRHGIDVHP